MGPVAQSNFVLIPSGKPDIKGGNAFKKYSGMKGDGNCILYSLLIANGFKKDFSCDSWKNIKEHRRTITKLDDGVWWRRSTLLNMVNGMIKLEPLVANKQCLMEYANNIVVQFNKDEKLGKIRAGTCLVAIQFLQKYRESSCLDIFEFAETLKKKERVANHENFLNKEKIDPDVLCLSLRDTMGTFGFKLDMENLSDKYHLLHEAYSVHLYSLFKMEWCSWTPFDEIEVFSQLLKERGSLVAGACLGSLHSKILPKKMDKEIGEYQVWEWGENYEQDLLAGGHTVVVAGVDQGKVYFIDPKEPSEPGIKRRIFGIPYHFFCDKVINSLGLVEKGNPIKDPSMKYVLAAIRS